MGSNFSLGNVNLLTANSPADAKRDYKIDIPSHINADTIAVNKDLAPKEYEAMFQAYGKLKKSYQNIGTILTNNAKKIGGSAKKDVLKIAKQCTNQGTYCGNRQKNLKELFKYAQLESRVKELEDALAKIAASPSGSSETSETSV